MLPFLSNLGVVDTDQGRSPTAASFPSAFNPQARNIWDTVVVETLMSDDPDLDWAATIRAFVEACAAQDVFPFTEPKPVTTAVYDDLVDARQALVETVDQIKLFEVLWPINVTREVQLTAQGFQISVCGRFKDEDPTIQNWARDNGFTFDGLAREWVRDANSEARLFINLETANVGYNVTVRAFPSLPDNPMPSRQELEQFVLAIMWTPITRLYRFQGTHSRLM